MPIGSSSDGAVFTTSGTTSGAGRRVSWPIADHERYVEQRATLFRALLGTSCRTAVADLGTGHAQASAREIFARLGLEAHEIDVTTPIEVMQGEELADRIGFIPILRAGLGMVDAFLELMPTAQVWHLGLFRDERTLRPVEYYNKLPNSAAVDLCLILDPMLATGGSATAAIEVLKRWGAVRIKLVNIIAAPEGVEAVSKAHPEVEIYTAALDRQLNEKGYIMPGLGDAGDRQFGTGGAG